MKSLKGKIKVDAKIKPLPFKKRKAPEPHIGDEYFVSFGNNNVYPCTLLEIINKFSETEVRIEIPMKSLSKKGFIDINGNRSNQWTQTNILRTVEIGETPELAVRNTVG